MALFRVYIEQQAITRETIRGDLIAYVRTVRASNCTEALDKCLPEIARNVIPTADSTIKYISVHVGRKGNATEAANRLQPIQIIRETGARRNAR